MFKMRKIVNFLLIGLLLSFAMSVRAEPVEELFRQSGDPVAGNPKGNVTIVEFFDYQCGHCANMAPTISAIIKSNPEVRVVFKDLPIRGNTSKMAARAALAAAKQGKYYQFNHALFNASNTLTEQSIMDIASNLGLNMAKFKKDMKSREINKQIDANMQLAQQLKITGTPAFFIGKTDATMPNQVNFILGEMSQSELQNAIDKSKS